MIALNYAEKHNSDMLDLKMQKVIGDKDIEGDTSDRIIEEICRQVQGKRMILDGHRNSTPIDEEQKGTLL